MDSGLAGLVVAETVLSHSDGAQGILWVRGYTLAELVAGFGYEGAVGLLWEAFAAEAGFPERPERESIRARLAAAREAAFAALGDWLDRGAGRPVVEGVRIASPACPMRLSRRRSSPRFRWRSAPCCAAAGARRRWRPTRR